MKTIVLCICLLTSAVTHIDEYINSYLTEKSCTPSGQCDCERLARRYYLVVTDRIPTEAQTLAFIKNPDRTALVDSLLASDGFVDKLVLKWGDLLRIKSEFPSCMWPNAVQAFNKWLKEEFRANTPYNVFVKDMLLCTGSNFRVPQTNFYRAGSDRTSAKFTSDIALLFNGRRQAPSYWNSFFCQVKFKSTKEWKEEILCIDIDARPSYRTIQLPGRTVSLKDGTDLREPFVDWLVSTDNPDFARSFVNRFWSWFFGKGLMNPVDDLDNAGTPACEALLDYLTNSFIKSGYDVRALAREILLSEAFSRSTISNPGNASDRSGLSHYPLNRMTAEQICDALCDITGIPDKYSSRAPEPFTNFPLGTRAIEVCDGTITTPQLDIFGRPSRDVALESSRNNSVNSKQMLYLLNSTDIQNKLSKSTFVAYIAVMPMKQMVQAAYLRVLARRASDVEVDAILKWAEATGADASSRIFAQSLVWALLNTDEFLFIN